MRTFAESLTRASVKFLFDVPSENVSVEKEVVLEVLMALQVHVLSTK